MKEPAQALLSKLLKTRPKPSEAALREFFMSIKATPIDELMKLVMGRTDLTPANASELETKMKQHLRKVKGKASDFVPYLLEEITAQMVGGGKIDLPAKPTLSSAIASAEQLLGAKAADAATAAFNRYVKENDISYQLKSA